MPTEGPEPDSQAHLRSGPDSSDGPEPLERFDAAGGNWCGHEPVAKRAGVLFVAGIVSGHKNQRRKGADS